MIHRIFSTSPTFKAMKFRPGLNIVLSDKSRGASDLQTRNRAGKSSLVELIHFLTGGNCDPDSIFRDDALVNATFAAEIDVAGQPTAVERSGSEPSKLEVSGDTSSWPMQPKKEKKSGRILISNTNWKAVLGKLFFNLAINEEEHEKYSPSFRSLFAYFVRRESAGAFREPIQQSSEQLTWDQQVAVSFLIGFDWTLPQAWQRLRDREKALGMLKQGAKDGVFGELIGKAADFRTQLTLAEERAKQMELRLSSFRVLPEYHDLEKEASRLTRDINELTNQNALDRQLVTELEKAIASEIPPPITNLAEVYQEAGVVLPITVLRRFEDVKRFHESVINNRKTNLQQETTDAAQRISRNESAQSQMVERRAEIMTLLRTSGALEHYTKLQGELAKLQAQTESLRQRLRTAEALETGQTELRIERAQLLTRLRQDYHEQADLCKSAILAFEELSSNLYENPGSLTISAEESGPRFEVRIHGEKSKGINNMQIFCFDWMLSQLCAARKIGPGFLVHDSHLFDGSDERQVAKALQLGDTTAEKIGWQYIVTMNSDVLPREFENHPSIVKPRLLDSDDGGLFGLRFG